MSHLNCSQSIIPQYATSPKDVGNSKAIVAAEFIMNQMTKPVTAFIAGQTAPPGKRMGHAGAIIERGSGLASDKIKAFEVAGVRVAKHPEEIPSLLV